MSGGGRGGDASRPRRDGGGGFFSHSQRERVFREGFSARWRRRSADGGAIAARRAGAREGATAIGRSRRGDGERARDIAGSVRGFGWSATAAGRVAGRARRGAKATVCERRGGSKRAAWRGRARARTLLRAPRYTASSRRRTKSGSFCCHSFVSVGFLCWNSRRLLDDRERARGIGQREGGRTRGGGDPRDFAKNERRAGGSRATMAESVC